MTISVVQSANGQGTGTGAWAATLGSGATAGSMLDLEVFAYDSGAAISSNSPTYNGSSYPSAFLAKDKYSPGGGNVYAGIWVYPDVGAGGTTLGATCSGGTVDGNVGWVAHEVAGLGATPAVDVSSSGAGSSGNVTSGSITTTHAAEYVLGAADGFAINMAAASGYTNLWNFTDHGFCEAGYQVTSSTGSFAYATNTGVSADWSDVIVGIYAAGGGTPHTATASLTVTPSLSAGRARGTFRTAALTVTPSASAGRTRGKFRTAALSVLPSLSAGRTRGHSRAASLTVTPLTAASRSQGHVRRALQAVIPAFVAMATGGAAKGERQLVRLVVAQYFGGTEVTADAGTCFQGGPLVAYGLGTAYPYSVRGVPDEYYTAGMPAGQNWGVVMSTTRVRRVNVRDSYGGGTSGWRARKYAIECQLELVCELPHIEEAGAGLDDLIDEVHALIAADRNLGTKAAYQAGTSPLLVIQAGEGREGITDETFPFTELDDKKGRYCGTATIGFEVLTMVAA